MPDNSADDVLHWAYIRHCSIGMADQSVVVYIYIYIIYFLYSCEQTHSVDMDHSAEHSSNTKSLRYCSHTLFIIWKTAWCELAKPRQTEF